MNKAMGPGALPHTRRESKEVARGITARATAALEPYLVRAGDAQLRGRDDGEVIDQLAEQMGLSPEEVSARIDVESSLQFSAMTELVADLMHTAVMRSLDWSMLVRSAWDVYHTQNQHLQRFLVYEAPDLEPDENATIWVSGQ